MGRRGSWRTVAAYSLTAAVLLAMWDLVPNRGGYASIPTPGGVWQTLLQHRSLLVQAALTSSQAAALGGILGVLVAGALAAVAQLTPRAMDAVERGLIVTYTVPLVAVGPALAAALPGAAVPVIASGFGVLYPFYVSATAGLGASSQVQKDLFALHAAGRLRTMWFLQVRASVPFILVGLKLAVPAALLGALIGEWFGSESGLGVIMVSGLRNGQSDLVAGAALTAVGLSLAGYSVLSTVERGAVHRRGLGGSEE